MNKQAQARTIPIQTFIVVPKQCPAGLEMTCDCCEHSGKEFQIVKTAPGSGAAPGFVTCHYSDAP